MKLYQKLCWVRKNPELVERLKALELIYSNSFETQKKEKKRSKLGTYLVDFVHRYSCKCRRETSFDVYKRFQGQSPTGKGERKEKKKKVFWRKQEKQEESARR